VTSTGGSRLYTSATRGNGSNTIYMKMVNAATDAQPVHITLDGVAGIEPHGTAVVLTGHPKIPMTCAILATWCP
jgi:hypothetical protein